MGLWSSFLDFLWPVAAKKVEPGPLPPLDFRAMRDEAVMRDLPSGMISISGATFTPSKPTVYNVKVGPDWKPWPPLQFSPDAEGKLRRITGSRGLQRRGNSTKPRAVVDAAGVRHPSLRAAAKAHGMAPATLWDLLAEGRGGWRYAD